jgi:hypothetical protein
MFSILSPVSHLPPHPISVTDRIERILMAYKAVYWHLKEDLPDYIFILGFQLLQVLSHAGSCSTQSVYGQM